MNNGSWLEVFVIIIAAIILLSVVWKLSMKTTTYIINTKEGFDGKKKTLYYFYSDRCGYCKTFSPEFEKASKLIQDKLNIEIKKISVDTPTGAELFMKMVPGESGVPTVVLDVDGKIYKYNGDRTAGSVLDFAKTNN